MPNHDGSDYAKETWKVTGGKMHYRTEKGERVTLRPGDTFHPTVKQVAEGSLENKATKVKDGPGPKASITVEKDIGLRTLEWGSKSALKKALDTSPMLTVEEMEAVGATGASGFVSDDVDRALAAREQEDNQEDD